MRFISCHNRQLHTLETAGLKTSPARSFATGLEVLDAVAPQNSFARGAVHELLFDSKTHTEPKFIAALIAGRASNLQALPDPAQPIIWSDPTGELYPPALTNLGFNLRHVYLLHPQDDIDEAWAVTECLRCPGVGAVIASPRRMSRIQARRFQLAAETGGTVGIFMRPRGRGDSIYAAATRWLVSPCPGERTIQRWKIQLLHGHGGRIGQAVFLEFCRETHSLRALETLPDRQVASPAARKTA